MSEDWPDVTRAMALIWQDQAGDKGPDGLQMLVMPIMFGEHLMLLAEVWRGGGSDRFVAASEAFMAKAVFLDPPGWVSHVGHGHVQETGQPVVQVTLATTSDLVATTFSLPPVEALGDPLVNDPRVDGLVPTALRLMIVSLWHEEQEVP